MDSECRALTGAEFSQRHGWLLPIGVVNDSRNFLDTNILLYAYDLDAPAKRAVALRLVEQGWTAPVIALSSTL